MKRRFNFTEIAVTDNDKLTTLAKSSLSRGMDSAEIRDIIKYFHSYQVEKGAIIYAEGDEEAFLFLIVSGTVNVLKADNKVISELRAGETVGEMTIIDELPRSANAVAASDVVVYAITRASFNELKTFSLEIWSKLLMNIAVCLSSRLRQTSKLLMKYMPQVEAEEESKS